MPSGKVQVDIRPSPDSELVQGYPGIPELTGSSFHGAAVSGVITVSPLKRRPIKGKRLVASLIKTEIYSAGAGVHRHKSTVVSQVLWARQYGTALVKMEMAFGLQIPEDAPPVGVHHQDLLASSSPLPQSIQISQKSGTGIFYHVEASLEIVPTRRLSCVKSVESECITQELPLVIDKADLLSTWPVYKSRALSEERCSQPQDAPSQLIARRPTTAYGVGDKVSIPVHIRTREACTVTTLTLTLKEVTSTRPPPRITSPGPSSPGPVSPGLVTQSTRDIFSETFEAVMAIEPGEDHRFQLEGTIPRRHSKMTCHGDVLSITYHIRISATVEGPVRRRPKRRQSSATVLEIENLPVTLCSWDTEQAKIRMDRIVTMRGDQPPQSLQAVMQASTTSSNALPPGELRQHQFNQRTGSFIEAQPSPQSYINFTATATSRPGTTQGPRSVMLSDSAPDLAAPPPSLYTDAGMLNSAEQAYHSARLAEQNDSSTSSDRRRRQSGGVEGLEKMTVSNPDGAEHTETQESPPRLPPQAPQEALKSEKQRFEDASRSVRKASEERALPTPYQQVADNKLRQQQGAYPTPGPAQDPRPAEADPWKAKNAQYLSNLAVAAFESAVAERDALLESIYTPGNRPQPPARDSAASEKARLAANSRIASGERPSTAQSTEQSLYQQAISDRDGAGQSGPALMTPANQLSQQQLQNVSSEKEGMRQHFEAQQGRRKVPTPPSGQQHSQAMSPQPAQRDLPRPATSADPPSIAEKQSTVTSDEAVLDSPVPPMSETNQENTSLNTTSLASLYRDPSVKWGKQRAVSPVHSDSGSSWHGDSCRSPV